MNEDIEKGERGGGEAGEEWGRRWDAEGEGEGGRKEKNGNRKKYF